MSNADSSDSVTPCRVEPILPTFSVVIETENLRSSRTHWEGFYSRLDDLARQTCPIQQANEVLTVVSGYVPEGFVEDAAERFPWLRVLVSPEPLHYTEAKLWGAQHATGEVVVFADADVQYQDTWLENLLRVFSRFSDCDIAAGNSLCRPDTAYAVSLNIFWIFTIQDEPVNAQRLDYFMLNNFAIRTDLVRGARMPGDLPFYRGRSVDHFKKLVSEKARVIYGAPGATGHHAPPELLLEWISRLAVLGRDYVASADYRLENESFVERRMPGARFKRFLGLFAWTLLKSLRNIRMLLRKDPQLAGKMLAGIHWHLANVTLILAGGALSLVARDAVLHLIRSREAGSTIAPQATF